MSAHLPYERMAHDALGAGSKVPANVPWVVTEKVHGANFCLVVAGDGAGAGAVRAAKRTGFLDASDDFFGVRALLPTLEPLAHAVFDFLVADGLVKGVEAVEAGGGVSGGAVGAGGGDGGAGGKTAADAVDADTVWIFGELAGGRYPHPDVVAPEGRVGRDAVQSGVWYSPDLIFLPFDVAVGTVQEGVPVRRYLPYHKAMKVASDAGFVTMKPLFQGSFAKAMEYQLGFDSAVPGLLGLPPLPKGTNKAEGVVVRCTQEGPQHDPSVKKAKRCTRLMLKRKIEEFSEAAVYDAPRAKPAKKDGGPSPLDLLKWEALALLTAARIDSAVSKVGALDETADKARCIEVLTLVMEDVLEELHASQGIASSSGTLTWRALRLSAADAAELQAEVRAAGREMIVDRVKNARKGRR